MLLPILILACLGFLIFAGAVIAREANGSEGGKGAIDPAARFLLGGGVPLLVTGVMIYLFIIQGGSTTVQMNAGSPSGMNVWSTWVGLWRGFLFLTGANTLVTLAWSVMCAVQKKRRGFLGAAIWSCALSVLAFFTVATYFPSA